MPAFFESIGKLEGNEDVVRRRAYGVIETIRGEFRRITFRPWPKVISLAEVQWLGRRTHERLRGDLCRLYFNQPSTARNYLTLKYIVSSYGTSYRTFLLAAQVLDEIARIKRSDAIVCEVTNDRIAERMMRRWGWVPHLEGSSRRHYIKRFYGQYPPARNFAADASDRVARRPAPRTPANSPQS